MVVLQYAFLTHIILMDPYDNPKHKKTLIGAVQEHLKFTESRLTSSYDQPLDFSGSSSRRTRITCTILVPGTQFWILSLGKMV